MKKITFILVMLVTTLSLSAVNLNVVGSMNVWNNNDAGYLMTEIGTSGI